MRVAVVSVLVLSTACGNETFLDASDGGAAAADGAANADAGASDGQAGVHDGATAGGCPAGMVRTQHTCIDAREVSRRDYSAFYFAAERENFVNLPLACLEKVDRSKLTMTLFDGDQDSPMRGIDWCDAFLYCRFAGKRLCGAIGGTSAATEVRATEWYEACSKGTQVVSYPLPPGATQNEDGRCVLARSGPSPVTRPGNPCEGAYPGLFDMIGNVEEWLDACEGPSADARCIAAGSAFDDELTTLDSSCTSTFVIDRRAKIESIGFRCCQ